jgi:predicted homoserine dehydrogenase-like protein
MILIDKALEKLQLEGKPIRVGMVGAGFMASGVALEIIKYRQGIVLVGIANRSQEKAKKAFGQAGITDVKTVSSLEEVELAIRENQSFITQDAFLLCQSPNIDVILEMTGHVEYGANIAMEAIKNKKHFVSFNAELFGTLGSILKHYADEQNVIFTLADGDQPVVEMNLYRFVKGLGVKPVMCGNIKGLHDPYRNPTTQEGFAKKWGQNTGMVTSFADGSKISFEQAVVANATGMGVGKRGMYGPTYMGAPISEAVNWYPTEKLLEGSGIVDYVVGAIPGPGIFVLGTINDPVQKHYLNLYKLGEGPLYCFYTPFHLCHFEVPNTIARAVLFNDTALAPIGKPFVDVITTAKKYLVAGEVLDGIGGYATYGLCENYDTARNENLLPLGLAEGCTLKRNFQRDEVITFNDVEIPEGRLTDKLWKEQVEKYGATN